MNPPGRSARDLFERAMEVPAEARPKFLDAACVGDPQLRAELDKLLRANQQMGGFLDVSTEDLPDALAGAATGRDPLIGRELGAWTVKRFLASGGFGAVYRGERSDDYQQLVAIKVMRVSEFSDDSMLERFRRERQALADLQHEYIATLLDGGSTEDGIHYLVMEYVDGLPITEYCDEKCSTIDERLRCFLKVCEAVQHAHTHFYLHRDIKPSNILVTGQGTPKLLDFGIAKVFDPLSVHRQVSLTRAGVPATPAYASPEQIRGDRKKLGTASDVYSLGVVLYELLAGKLPYTISSMAAMERIICDTDPEAPSTSISKRTVQVAPVQAGSSVEDSGEEVARKRHSTVASLRKKLRDDLDAVVLHALKKEPERRYGTVQEFAEDIKRYLDHRTVLARPNSTGYVLGKFFRRHRAAALLAVCLFTALVVAAVAVGRFRVEKRQREAAQLVREQTIPGIKALGKAGNFLAALQLAERAQAQFPNDQEVDKVLRDVSFLGTITTMPPGAKIEIRPAGQVGDWTPLGTSPLERRAPDGAHEWKISKPGHEDLVVLRRFYKNDAESLSFRLEPAPVSRPGMVRVPAQELNLLAFGERKLVKEYWIDRFEVTNRQYQVFIDRGGYETAAYWSELGDGWRAVVDRFRDKQNRLPGPSTWQSGKCPPGQEDFPVLGVSWYEAAAYARFVRKRLPTIYHWYGAAWSDLTTESIILNSNLGKAGAGPLGVGTSPSLGPHGTFDMAGNAWEWCWNETREGKRYILGGSWTQPSYMYYEPAAWLPLERQEEFGFRCAEFDDADATELLAVKDRRDYRHEEPCSQQEFEAFREFYAYDKSRALRSEVVGRGPRWERVEFDPGYESNERIVGKLFFPDENKYAKPYQAIIIFPASMALTNEDLPDWDLSFLGDTGRAIFLPMYWGTYKRKKQSFRQTYPTRDAPSAYQDAIVFIAKDFSRSVDYLLLRDDIRGDGLAYFGYSWGAALAPIFLALENRIRAAVLHCGGFIPIQQPAGADPLNFAARVRVPVLMLNGVNDEIFSFSSSQLPMFNAFPADTPKKHVRTEGGHWVSTEVLISEGEKWLDTYLGKPAPARAN